MKVGIGKASEILGVSIDTLRRWESDGKITSERTSGGHRRYDLALLQGLVPPCLPKERTTVCYACVSSHDQKKDLQRQIELLENYCTSKGWKYEVVQDLGSGMNYQKRGLQKIIQRICLRGIERLVLTHKDRLLRFGAELIFSLCEQFGVEVVIINAAQETTFEDDLVQDVLEIITVFSARLYGSRSRKNKKLMETLQEVAEGL
jgi:excisionase family DNA binding protein